MDARATAARKNDMPIIADGFAKIASALDKSDAVMWNNMDLGKLADAVVEMDKHAGLDAFYGKLFPDPILSVFNTDKIASDTVEVAGVPTPIDSLLEIPQVDYASIVGDDVAAEFFNADGTMNLDQFMDIWPTIPYDLQKVLQSQLGG